MGLVNFLWITIMNELENPVLAYLYCGLFKQFLFLQTLEWADCDLPILQELYLPIPNTGYNFIILYCLWNTWTTLSTISWYMQKFAQLQTQVLFHWAMINVFASERNRRWYWLRTSQAGVGVGMWVGPKEKAEHNFILTCLGGFWGTAGSIVPSS